jgi:hypothetical protein
MECGFYPSIGRCVELDEINGGFGERDEAVEADPNALAGVATLFKMIPAWAWLTFAGVLAIVGFSVAGRYCTPPDSNSRMIWALAQLAVAGAAAMFAHVRSFLHAVLESDKFGMADMILRPLAIWGPTIRDLRANGTGWLRLGTFSWGTTGQICALAIVGGIPYAAIWEAGPKEPPKQNLIAAVADAAREGSPETDGLADAVGRVDESGDGFSDKKNSGAAAKADEKRSQVDCLVIGYLVHPGGDRFHSLILATQVNKRLVYVGTVSNGFTPEITQQIQNRMAELPRETALVSCPVEGKWIRPAIACRVSYEKFTKNQRLTEIRFEKLLAEISVN